MENDPRLQEMTEIADKLFIMANSFAGDETGTAAAYLHEACNNIKTAKGIILGEVPDEIPIHMIASSIGLDLGKMVKDIHTMFEDSDNEDKNGPR